MVVKFSLVQFSAKKKCILIQTNINTSQNAIFPNFLVAILFLNLSFYNQPIQNKKQTKTQHLTPPATRKIMSTKIPKGRDSILHYNFWDGG